MTHHLGGHPPTNNESIPPTLGWCGTTQPTGISKRTRDPSTHRPRRTTSPPTTERWSHGWRVKSKRPPTPTTPLNYTNTQHRHSRRHYNESDGHPPPPPSLEHNTPASRAESSSTHGTLEVPSPEATPIHGAHGPGTPRPTPLDTSELSVKTQKHHSPLGLNMTTASDVVCPRCNMADFVYFRCTTCKYFAIHQPETPDLVPGRLYKVMSPDTLYPRQGSWQGAIPATTSHTYHTPTPHTTGPRPTTVDTPDGWISDVTSDGDVEPNPGLSPLAPSAKRTRYNQDTPLTYQTPWMLRKRTTDNTPPGHKRRRTDNLHMVYQEHQAMPTVPQHAASKGTPPPTPG